MAITPSDIQAQTFPEAKRGHDPGEVDVFRERHATEVDAMLNNLVDLKTRLTATEQELAAAQPHSRAPPAAAAASAPMPAPAPEPMPVADPFAPLPNVGADDLD